jgi:acyl-homoserine lactone synthase
MMLDDIMFAIINGSVDDDNPPLADRIYRFRHDFFVDRLGWEACRKPDRRDRDQFDGPDALHIVGEERGEIVTYARLLPTTRPHLLSHLYPELMRSAPAPAPVGRRVYEWTRHAILPKRREWSDAAALSDAAIGAVARAAELLKLEGLLAQIHPTLVGRLMDTGWDVEPLALPIRYDGRPVLPVYARLTAQTIATARAALARLRGAQLRLPGDWVPAPIH